MQVYVVQTVAEWAKDVGCAAAGKKGEMWGRGDGIQLLEFCDGRRVKKS